MSDERLKEAVQTILSSFLEQRQSSHDDIAEDVYRSLRDEANLLLEREAIYNVFDSDPFGLVTPDDDADEDDVREKEKNADMIARCKKMMKVVSCSRTATGDGYSFIQAVVQLNSDGKMQGVNENVHLHFSFLREPQNHDDKDDLTNHAIDDEMSCEQYSNGVHKLNSNRNSKVSAKRKRGDSLDISQTKKPKHSNNNVKTDHNQNEIMNCDDSTGQFNNSGFRPKTIITYKVEYSVDWGRQEKLFGVDIYAAGDFPSVKEAIPMMDGDDDSFSGADSDEEKSTNNVNGDENDNENKATNLIGDTSEFEEIEMSSNEEKSGERAAYGNAEAADRFGVFVDPQNILAFLERLNVNFNEQSVFHFLLMFPFYEHEWDISGFLLASLFDDDENDCDEEVDSEKSLERGVCIPCPTNNIE